MENIPVGTSAYIRTEKGNGYVYYHLEGSGDIISSGTRIDNSEHYSHLHFDGNFEEIQADSLKGLFSNHHKFISLVFRGTVTKIGDNVFKPYYNIKEGISLPEGLKSIGNEVFASSQISSVIIPSTLVEIAPYAFFLLSELNSFKINGNNSHYSVEDGVLYNKDKTELVRYPSARTGGFWIPSTVRKICAGCFANSKITNLIVPNSVEIIEDKAFYQSKIEEIAINNPNAILGESVFCWCYHLNSVKLPKNLQILPKDTFYGANSLSTIKLPKTLKKIGIQCFRGASLSQISIPEGVEEIGSYAFLNNKIYELKLPSSIAKLDDNFAYGLGYCTSIYIQKLYPFRITSETFRLSNINTKLVIPTETKFWFKFAPIWNGKIKLDSVDHVVNRISKGVSSSELLTFLHNYQLADASYLTEVLSNYVNSLDNEIETEVVYQAHLEAIKMNYRFNPPLIPSIITEIADRCNEAFKIKLIKDVCLNMNLLPTANLSLPDYSYEVKKTESLDSLNPELLLKNASNTEVYFTGIKDIILEKLSTASTSVKVAVSWLLSLELFNKLIELSRNGVKIEIVTNNDLINNGGYCLNLQQLIDEGIDLHLSEWPEKLIHHKFCIIDNNIVINGSFNWTRNSEANEENIMVFEGDEKVSQSFVAEFDRLLATYPKVDKMPETVPDRPQYDRSSFKQYITEELSNIASGATSFTERIASLQRAESVNKEFLKQIRPNYEEEIKETESAKEIKSAMVEFAKEIVKTETTGAAVVEPKEAPKQNKEVTPKIDTGPNPTPQNTQTIQVQPAPAAVSVTVSEVEKNAIAEEKKQEQFLDQYSASKMFMAVDVSGSMKNMFNSGTAHNVIKKAISVGANLTEKKDIEVWTFGDEATLIGNVGLRNLDLLSSISSKNEGTYVRKFIEKIISKAKDSLVLIFTDGDFHEKELVLNLMMQNSDTYWQILGIGSSFDSLNDNLYSIDNASLVSCNDINSKTDKEISEMIFMDYMSWKAKKGNN